jgi:Copper transport outer membrane protein, MctB
MIDFRYHIVSIVSIFLALAVGIVLGAGPLQGRLGDTLNQEVSALRKTKTDLNIQLRESENTNKQLNAFITALTPQLIEGRLSGRSVNLIRLPGSSDDVAKSVSDVLTQAGAKVNGTVKVTKDWTDPAKKAFRESLATSLAPLARTQPPAGATQGQDLSTVLARGVVVPDRTSADKADAGAATALKGLKTGGLIDYSGDPPDPATLAVVVAGPPTANEQGKVQEAEATSYAALTRVLDAQSAGAVAVSQPSGAQAGGTLQALRADQQAKASVSTFDYADQQMGLITVVLALREQISGDAGQYGIGAGVDKITADLSGP